MLLTITTTHRPATDLGFLLHKHPAARGHGRQRGLEPLGYDVGVAPIALDPTFPDWGDGRHVGLRLAGEVRLADLLNHLHVLLPVLDDDKHYRVDEAEIEVFSR